MLFSATGSANPALSIMQSIVDEQFRAALLADPNARRDEPQLTGLPGRTSTVSPRALEEIYFGDHLTVTEVKIKLLTHLSGYLANEIDEQTKFETENPGKDMSATAGYARQAIEKMDGDERSSLRIALGGNDGDIGSSLGTAIRISLSFDLDRLSRDRELIKYLEQMIGFDLDGMSVADLVKSFIEPQGKSAERVNAVISESLAGQAGSKAMQRLEDAASGPKTVEEAKKAAAEKKSYEEIDEETKAEDEADIDTARVMETLGRVVGDAAAAAEASKAEAEADAVIEKIKAIGHTETESGGAEPGEPEDEPDTGTDGYRDGDDPDDAQERLFAPLYL